MNNNKPHMFLHQSPALFILLFLLLLLNSFKAGDDYLYPGSEVMYNDINNDGMINILIIGSTSSINGGQAFSPNQIASELQSILVNDPSISIPVNVVSENIYTSKVVTLGFGGGGSIRNWTHYRHSLTQYYYWPDGLDARMDNLSGNDSTDWDYVVIGADPYIVANTPGYYSLGVNKVAAKVVEGDAEALLLMMWPKDENFGSSIEHFEEFTYRTSDGAKVNISTVPAGLAWDALPANKKDVSSTHPSPNGAYLAAASIYSHIYNKSASSSTYTYDDEVADIAFSTETSEENEIHYSGERTFISPYKGCDINDVTINYNQTGSSTEAGIRVGMQWIFNQSPQVLQSGGTSPINFNYGRANSNWEANKRYKIDSALFDYSFGLPMQDHGNHGNVSMLYGLDKRQAGVINDTDVGVARFMINNSELPYARAIPIRTLYAQMKEAIPGQSAYRDSWHMHRDLDKAIGAFMYTMLTGDCQVGEEPVDQTTASWRTWQSHKIGYETAWNFMHLKGVAPSCYKHNWLGLSDTEWENPDNWEGGIIPDANSDVFFPAGLPYYPIINENVIINSMEFEGNIEIKVITGFKLEVLSIN